MTTMLARLGEAQPGDLVRCDVHRRTKRSDGWSTVEHICEVLHRHGPANSALYVRPICGGDAGRAGSHWTAVKLCRSCERAAERRGVQCLSRSEP